MRLIEKPIERRGLVQEIADRLIAAIREDILKPGDKLPPERVLKEQFQVGRSSLREAIGALTIMGMLEAKPGRGTYVSELSATLVPAGQGARMDLTRAKVEEVIEARQLLEEGIASLAAGRAETDDISQLERALEVMKANVANRRRFIRADVEFHICLAKAAKNAIFVDLISLLRSRIQIWMEEAIQVPGLAQSGVSRHQRILEAIAAHDPSAAREAVARHLAEVADGLRSVILSDT